MWAIPHGPRRRAGARLSTGGWGQPVDMGRVLWTVGRSTVDDDRGRGGTSGLSAPTLAPDSRQGIELLPRTPATGSGTTRRRGSTRRSASVLEGHRGGWVTRPLGPEETSASTGSVTGTGHPKGPCDSYPQGPFTHFRRSASAARADGGATGARCRPSADPAQLWESEPFLWTAGRRPVDDVAISGGTRRMFARTLARGVTQGIELLPRTPARGSGTARRRGSRRCGAGVPARHRGGEVTTPAGAGVEEQSIGSVTGTDHLKGPWNSYFRGPFAHLSPRCRACRGVRRTGG